MTLLAMFLSWRAGLRVGWLFLFSSLLPSSFLYFLRFFALRAKGGRLEHVFLSRFHFHARDAQARDSLAHRRCPLIARR